MTLSKEINHRRLKMAKKNCEDCGKEFEYTPPVNYPDKRKYCDSCSQKRRQAYEQGKTEKSQPQASQEQNQVSGQQSIRHDTFEYRVKPHSYEFGKAGDRFKIYYEDLEDLKQHLQALRDEGFLVD